VTAPLPEGQPQTEDVRKMTQRVAYFITPKPSDKPQFRDKSVPPATRFRWGTFRFDGIVESMDESLEFFSADGRPLRAGVSLSITQQSIQFALNDEARAARTGSRHFTAQSGDERRFGAIARGRHRAAGRLAENCRGQQHRKPASPDAGPAHQPQRLTARTG
jgi:hypothetical protein